MVDKRPDETLEYYNSPAEILEEDDIIETDVKVLGWNKKFRIRALTFGQMNTINKNATNADTGALQQDEWAYWTIVEGVVRPKFKIAQARLLSSNNGEFVKNLADEIWGIGRISKKVWDEFIEESNRAIKAGKDDFKDLTLTDEETESNKV
jgi:hypothetical protein